MNPSDPPTIQALTPTYHLGPATFPLACVDERHCIGCGYCAFDSFVFIERLGDYEQTTTRCRTEQWVPAAWAELWMLDRIATSDGAA